jgi:hypothetical protein
MDGGFKIDLFWFLREKMILLYDSPRLFHENPVT